MATLGEDMIMEIVARLPLKNAIQCLVLNKSLFRLISQRKHALASSSYPNIKSSIFCYDILKRFEPGSCEKSVTLPRGLLAYDENPIIADSCNGILLIRGNEAYDLWVFNPITGGIMSVGKPFSLFGTIKLAVDLNAHHNSTTFHFKLVNVICDYFSPLWEIYIFAPAGRSGRPSWLLSSPKIYEGGCYCCSDKSVYANGCMYWPLCKKPNVIMVLDLEKEEIGTISWPFSAAPLLFGLSDGSLQSTVCEFQHHEIVIQGYDEVKDEWVLKHKIISNIIGTGSRVVFFDGQRLLIVQEDDYGKYTSVMIHDILSGKWEEISFSDVNSYGLYYSPIVFYSFVPSLANVSDEYLDMDKFIAESEFDRPRLIFYNIAALQQLITQESNAWKKLQEIEGGGGENEDGDGDGDEGEDEDDDDDEEDKEEEE